MPEPHDVVDVAYVEIGDILRFYVITKSQGWVWSDEAIWPFFDNEQGYQIYQDIISLCKHGPISIVPVSDNYLKAV